MKPTSVSKGETNNDNSLWWKISLYFVGTLVLGSLLAPPLYLNCKAFAAANADNPLWGLTDALRRSDFARYFDRAILIAALLLIYPTIKWVGDWKTGEQKIGWNLHPSQGSWIWHLLAGFVFASALLLILGLIYLQGDFFYFRHPDNITRGWSNALISAGAVALLEEVFFRGLLLALLMRSMKTFPAALFLTILFATIHFAHPPDEDTWEPIRWWSGFAMTEAIFGRLLQPAAFLAEWLTLFAVGWVLVSCRLRSGSIWLPVGLHAGWVFGLKHFNFMTRATLEVKEGKELPLVGESLRLGLAPLCFILGTWGLALLYLRWNNKNSASLLS